MLPCTPSNDSDRLRTSSIAQTYQGEKAALLGPRSRIEPSASLPQPLHGRHKVLIKRGDAVGQLRRDDGVELLVCSTAQQRGDYSHV